MGKKKGKKGRKMPKPHVGAIAGGAATLVHAATSPDGVGGSRDALTWLMDASQPVSARMKYAGSAFGHNMMEAETYKPVVLGCLISASPRLPIVGIVARPVDNAIVALTHGKWRL